MGKIPKPSFIGKKSIKMKEVVQVPAGTEPWNDSIKRQRDRHLDDIFDQNNGEECASAKADRHEERHYGSSQFTVVEANSPATQKQSQTQPIITARNYHKHTYTHTTV